ncbi:MAG: hypothetical protein V4689_10080 [Verrucomicrobiota bacterium]
MKILHQALFFLLLITVSSALSGEAGKRVFSAGHSFHFHVPAMLEEVAKSGGFPAHQAVGKSMIGGSKSIQHWSQQPNGIKDALQVGRVDVLTLTPIYLPDEGVEKFAELGLKSNPDFKVTVQEFWLPFDEYQPSYYNAPTIPTPLTVDHDAATVEKLNAIHAKYFTEMDALVTEVNGKVGKPAVAVVPVGQAVIALRGKIIEGKAPGLKSQEMLFTDPLGHPTPALQLLVVYCHFAVIYQKSPVGLPVPEILSTFPPDVATALSTLLQQIAWDAVTGHPLSGVKN